MGVYDSTGNATGQGRIGRAGAKRKTKARRTAKKAFTQTGGSMKKKSAAAGRAAMRSH